MIVPAYYNEIDPFAADWLRRLMIDELIAWGDVDERSIEDVTPDDLRSYRQCHFFAGIGVWSLALREAGWPDDRPIWTGSCPCQPFSAAGKGGGFDDERHLWPAFHWLIEQCGPSVIVGEQVASKDGLGWLDLVQADVEGTGYAFGAVDTCAAGFGAPHIRQRLYWVADALGSGQPWPSGSGTTQDERTAERDQPGRLVGLADALDNGRGQHRDGVDRTARASESEPRQRQRLRFDPADGGATGGVGDAGGAARERHARAFSGAQAGEHGARLGVDGRVPVRSEHAGAGVGERPGPTNGLWRDADWLGCTDGKWRPVEPGTFPLANAGAFRNRVGLLRGAGNAITLGQAQGFIEAVMACRP